MKRKFDKSLLRRINRAKQQADIRQILSVLSINYKERQGDIWFKCVHRNHKNDKKASSHIVASPFHPLFGLWHCFGCPAKGDIISLVRETWNLSFFEALVLVENYQVNGQEVVKPFYNTEAVLPKYYQSPRIQSDWDERYLNYLFGRGITWQQILAHKLGYVDSGRYDNRIIVPIMLSGKFRTFVARSILPNISDEERITSAFHGKEGLFNSELSNPKYGPAIISEGWTDALKIERLGYPNSMSTQTNRLLPEQAEYLKRFPYTIFLPDGDDGGRRFNDSLVAYVDDMEIFVGEIPEGQDPDSADAADVDFAIQECKEWEPSIDVLNVDIVF